ncbi:MAG TPA: phenylalanine--tRNA ligase subunit alpha [Actinomycetota bacterium]
MDANEVARTIEAERERGLAMFAAASTMDQVDAAQVEIMGRKSAFGMAQKALGSLDAEGRRTVGKLANEVRAQLQAGLDERREALRAIDEAALLEADRVDLSLPGRRPRTGSLHPLTIVERQVVGVFVSLGFRVVEGPEIEDDWHNFEALNIPPDHPARTMKDTIYPAIPGRPDLVLRTETSAAQIRTMESQPPPISVISPGRVYRRETSDPTHLPVFHQVEGLVVDEGITFAHLKGTLEAMAKALFGETRRIRLGPAYFPFVEPGAEVAVSCFKCEGVGCNVCGNGWIELLGSGMVHPKVLENCGYDSERYTGFAFGVGIERIALLRYAIPDIRMFVDNDIRFLAQFEGVT